MTVSILGDKRNKPGKILYFRIPGKPLSHQSMRIAAATDKRGNQIYEFTKSGKKRPKIIKYQKPAVLNDLNWIKWHLQMQRPLPFDLFSGPILIRKLIYIFPATKEIQKKFTLINGIFYDHTQLIYKSTKPDLQDNLNKILFDAMANIIYYNDSQICSIDNLKKIYGTDPRIELTLEEL